LGGEPDFVIGSLGELAGILGLWQKYLSAQDSLAV